MGAQVDDCAGEGRERSTIVSSLNGALLRETDPFPYYMLVAFEAGGILRAFPVLLAAPIYLLLLKCWSRASAIQLIIFVSLAGLKVKRIESVAQAVLPKFFRDDINSGTWTKFCTFETRYLLTSTPRIMVQTFAEGFLGVNEVFGTELQVTKSGRVTGLIQNPGVLVGDSKAAVLREKLGSEPPDLGVGHGVTTDESFLDFCKVGA
jgi:glycerol-3-phosphate acyltransferase